MAVNIQFSQSQKGKAILISNSGYSYIRHSESKNAGTEYWACELKRKCPGRGISRLFRTTFEDTTQHNHAPDPVRREVRAVKETMKTNAGNAIGANTTTNILHSALRTASDAAKAVLPQTEHLKRSIQRSRNAAHIGVPLPNNRDGINVPQQFSVTGNGRQFLLWDSGPAMPMGQDERILMFATQENVDFLGTCDSILID